MLTNNIISFEQLGPDIFLISPQKKKYIDKALLMSTHNIYFHTKIRKILCGYQFSFRAMKDSHGRNKHRTPKQL